MHLDILLFRLFVSISLFILLPNDFNQSNGILIISSPWISRNWTRNASQPSHSDSSRLRISNSENPFNYDDNDLGRELKQLFFFG
jgi:hypothetical protein